MIYTKATRILATYYDAEGDEIDVAPAENANANQFGFRMQKNDESGGTGKPGFNFGGGFN